MSPKPSVTESSPLVGDDSNPKGPAESPTEKGSLEPLRFRFSWLGFARFCGPALLTSPSMLDPGNLEADLQLGAYTGSTQLWVVVWAAIICWFLQELAGRMTLACGLDLATAMRAEWPLWTTLAVYLHMELAVLAADVQGTIGSAIGLRIVFGLPVWAGLLIAATLNLCMVAAYRWRDKAVDLFICACVGVIGVASIASAMRAGVEGPSFVKGLAVPTLQPWGLFQVIAAIGANIEPHNFYLYTSSVAERRPQGASDQQIWSLMSYARIEMVVVLVVTIIINSLLAATFWSAFYQETCSRRGFAQFGSPLACFSDEMRLFNVFDASKTSEGVDGVGEWLGLLQQGASGGRGISIASISAGRSVDGSSNYTVAYPVVSEALRCSMPHGGKGACGAVNLQDAGRALKVTLSGTEWVQTLWGLGLLASGQGIGISCLISGQVLFEGCLSIHNRPWLRPIVTRGASVLLAVVTLAGGDVWPLIQVSNVIKAVQLPFAVFPTIVLASNPRLLGRFTCRGGALVVICAMTAIVVLADVYFALFSVWSYIGHVAVSADESDPAAPPRPLWVFSSYVWVFAAACVVTALYLGSVQLIVFSRANQHNLDRFTVGKRVEGWLQRVSDATETGKSHDAESAQRGAGRNEAITRRTV